MTQVSPSCRGIIPLDQCVYQPRGNVISRSGDQFEVANSDEARHCRDNAFRLADAIIESHQSGLTELPETTLTHYFADGCYFRQLAMPAGIVGVAMIHKHEHVVHVSYGDFFIVDGERSTRMTGAQTFISRPGAQRCFVVLADTMISTVHRMRDPSCTDIEEVERMFFCRSEEEFQEYLKEEQKCLVC